MMFALYDLKTGLFTGQSISQSGATEQSLAARVPKGLGVKQGEFDHLAQKVNLLTGCVVSWKPPRPPRHELVAWGWDAKARRWVPHLTVKGRAEEMSASIKQAIAHKEAELARPLREVALAQAAGAEPPAAAVHRLRQVDDEIQSMRDRLARVLAAKTAKAIDAIERENAA